MLTKDQLRRWVDYALENDTLLLFDAAYEAYIQDDDIPHSIYEIKGARKVAIEFRSYSKTAGFTGVRCGYTVIPKEVTAATLDNKNRVELNHLWNRRQSTKFNGTSYISQRAAEAIYTPEGKKQIKETIAYYMDNAAYMLEALKNAGMEVYGGRNAPYIWLKTPNNMSSWDFFDKLLHEVNIVGTPGAGFGPCGEGYFRLTAFGDAEKTKIAAERIKAIVKTIQPQAKIIECDYAKVDLDEIINTGMFHFERVATSAAWIREIERPLDEIEAEEHHHHDDEEDEDHEHDHEHEHEHEHHHHHHHHEGGETEEYGIGTFVYYRRPAFDIHKFDRFMSTKWPKNVIRAKGVCYFAHNRDMSFLFEQAGSQKQLSEAGLWYATAPENELAEMMKQEPGLARDWDEKYGDRMQKIVFIGQHLDKAQLAHDLDECLEE